MPHFNRLFGQYRASFDSDSPVHAFEGVQAAMRAAYRPGQGYTVRVVKGKKQWSILVHKGLTTGFGIDFVPVPAAFGPPQVEIRVGRHSRLMQLAIYPMAGVLGGAVALYYLGNFAGWWAANGLSTLLVGALLTVALVMTFAATAAGCSYIGGRLSNDQLTAIRQTVGDAIEMSKGGQRPGTKSLAEQGAAPDRGGIR
jgi:hypothetical protein